MIDESKMALTGGQALRRRLRGVLRYWAAAGALLAGTYGGGASAQTTSQPTESAGLEEVVVTARYRAESLQETPIAITALSATDLEERNFKSVDDLGAVVPNAYFRPPVSNYGPTETIGLRGITQVDYSYSFEPAVALYVDDVYHGTMTGSSMDLADLERVEVLNGPQGTLFGKNSLGGAIRLISTKPKGDDTGSVEATYGQHHRVDVKAIGDFSVLPDTLFVRVIGVSRTMDGIGKHLDFACEMAALGTPALSGTLPMTVTPTQGNGCAQGSLRGYDHKGVRAEIRYLATSDLEINFDANYSKQADDPPLQALLSRYGGQGDTTNIAYNNAVVQPKYGVCFTCDNRFNSPSVWDNYATYGDVVTGQQYDPTQYVTQSGESLTATYRIAEKLNAKFIGAYQTYQANWINDSDLTPFGITQTYNQQEHRQYTAELQLNGTQFADRLDWTTGLFYYTSKDRDYYPTNFDADALPQPPVFPNGLLPNFVANDYYHDNNKSAFVHGTFKLTDQWSVSAGVRYTDETKSNLFQHTSTYPPDSVVVPYPKGISESRFDYNGTVDFQATQDMLFYGSIATGFRSPGFNPRISTVGQLVEVPGEEARQYELGNKADFFEHRLRVNTAVFYIDYQAHLNLTLKEQCNAANDPNPGTPVNFLTPCPAGTALAGTFGIGPWFVYTVAPADIRGAEMQVTANPLERLNLNYSIGFNQFRSKTSNPLDPAYIDPSVKQQPELNMSAGAQYAVLLPSASLTPRLDWYYQSFATNGAVNLHQTHPDDIVPGYGIFNATVSYTPNEAKWNLTVGATNLFNKFYWQQLGAATATSAGLTYPASARVGTPGLPREWFVTLRKNF